MELQILPAGMNVFTFFSLLNDTRSIHGKKKAQQTNQTVLTLNFKFNYITVYWH